ncbi:uncharacterized protein LOC133779043 [Humulus lupulus]|uniref:uncharacterized protein LOC133779043 n=1 Tax=Humulus lupulus TaxID=3486 RepID=UPI002B402D1C|nr:uncharacterized protein LOC133779043 [Humulus lupulus]
MLVLDLHKYDVIFGMDWLNKYGVVINYKHKKVVFTQVGEQLFEFKGTPRKKKWPMISALKVRRMLDNGWIGYLANIVDKEMETKLKSSDVLVVCKFPEVFPEYLPRIPPDREVVLEIELISGMAPISKALY